MCVLRFIAISLKSDTISLSRPPSFPSSHPHTFTHLPLSPENTLELLDTLKHTLSLLPSPLTSALSHLAGVYHHCGQANIPYSNPPSVSTVTLQENWTAMKIKSRWHKHISYTNQHTHTHTHTHDCLHVDTFSPYVKGIAKHRHGNVTSISELPDPRALRKANQKHKHRLSPPPPPPPPPPPSCLSANAPECDTMYLLIESVYIRSDKSILLNVPVCAAWEILVLNKQNFSITLVVVVYLRTFGFELR